MAIAEPAGQANTRDLLKLLALALGIRLLMVSIAHPWDGQTWVNAFSQLQAPGSFLEAVARPYEAEREQSLLTQAAGRLTDHYEGWAYPPLMLYTYWPLAHLYGALGGQPDVTFPVQPALIAPVLPLPILFLTRLPVIAADLATLVIMRALGVGARDLRWYAFNPLVLLVGVWTIDAVMVVFLLLALLLAERRRWGLAGLALGLGTATKFIPLVALPVLLLKILVAEDDLRSKMTSAGSLLAGTVVSLAVLIAPVADGVRYALAFHADRFGTGLTIQEMLSWWAQSIARFDWQPVLPLYLTVFLGPWTLVLAILVAAWAVVRRLPSLRIGVLVFVLAFLAGSKLVNEPYVLAAVALTTVALARQPSNGLRGCRTLLWGLAFAYAVLNLPPWAFLTSALQQLASSTAPSIALWASAYVVSRSGLEAIVPFALLGTAFTATVVAAAVIALSESPLRAPGEELA